MRLAYVKFNNCVRELKQIKASKRVEYDGGPEAYIANILGIVGKMPLLLVSYHDGDPDACLHRDENVTAMSFKWPNSGSFKGLLARVYLSLRLVRELYKFRPSHIYCWENDSPLWFAFVYALFSRKRFVASVHTRISADDLSARSRLRASIDNVIFRRSDAVICHGPYLKQQLMDIGVRNERILEFNWSYGSLCRDKKRELDGAQPIGKRKFYYVGRIFGLKGVFDLFEAMRELLHSKSDLELVYVGDGPDADALKSVVEREGLSEKVKFAGRVPNERLGEVLSDAYVVVTPTRKQFPEGRCMSAIEPIVLGIPVIAPNYGPFRYVLEHEKEGLLYEVDEVASLRATIERIATDELLRKRLADGAKAKSIEYRSPERTFRQALRSALAFDE